MSGLLPDKVTEVTAGETRVGSEWNWRPGRASQLKGKRGVGRSRGGSAPPLPEVGRGARGSAGRGGVGFQSAGDSGRGPRAGSLPAVAAAQHRLCFLQEGRAAASAQRPFASAELGCSEPSGLGRPGRWRQGRTCVPVPRPPQPLPPASPSLTRPLLTGETSSVGACCGCVGSARFSSLQSGPTP